MYGGILFILFMETKNKIKQTDKNEITNKYRVYQNKYVLTLIFK